MYVKPRLLYVTHSPNGCEHLRWRRGVLTSLHFRQT